MASVGLVHGAGGVGSVSNTLAVQPEVLSQI